MKTLFETIRATLHSGSAVVLCSIIASAGSTLRGAGAKMAVLADGTATGTIGLPIGAETPAEIAISVAGELIRHRAKQHGGQK